MTTYYMLRSFDHAGYYETRLILMVVALGLAYHALRRKQDSRYLVMLISGVFFQALMEYVLQVTGMRGPGYHFSVFGVSMSGIWANLFQGLAEGAIFSVMAFWFVDLKTSDNPAASRTAYRSVFTLIALLSCVVGYLSRGQPVTSPRPMFGMTTLIWFLSTAGPAIVLAAWRHGLHYLGYFFSGLFIYSVVTFEPLHILGARYIGQRSPSGAFVAAPMLVQILVMLYSHLIEVASQKIHYFAVPFAMGLIRFRDRQPQ
jgi:hypothetical protein